jgi:nitrate reductase delta subunit
MNSAAAVALGYDYPTPDGLDALAAAVAASLRGVALRRMTQFIDAVAGLELGEWEELHTRTLDLSPLFIPYVGHVEFGENYRRGEFMADLKRDMELTGIDLRGELPDHIEPILRYVGESPQPLADLLDVLVGAVKKMQSTLEKAEKDNPYRYLLAATLAVVEDLKPVVIGPIR